MINGRCYCKENSLDLFYFYDKCSCLFCRVVVIHVRGQSELVSTQLIQVFMPPKLQMLSSVGLVHLNKLLLIFKRGVAHLLPRVILLLVIKMKLAVN